MMLELIIIIVFLREMVMILYFVVHYDVPDISSAKIIRGERKRGELL